MSKYTLERLKPSNAVYDSYHRLRQDDVEMINRFVELIENTRKDVPFQGDIIEYTDEYGHYSNNAHIQSLDSKAGLFSVSVCSYVPFVFKDDEHGVTFNTGGGPWVTVDPAALAYAGKREKTFIVFGNSLIAAHSGIYFQAQVNVWVYTEPNQRHPGYSTKDWDKYYISYAEKPADGSGYRYVGRDIAFKTATELQHWKKTYKAVEFPGCAPNQTILFLYKKCCSLITREEWDNLDLPLDTRRVNGIIHVKVDYDDKAHMVTAYRFTNSGYLDPRKFGPYERAKGTALVPPDIIHRSLPGS
jgi:hypothetical protein